MVVCAGRANTEIATLIADLPEVSVSRMSDSGRQDIDEALRQLGVSFKADIPGAIFNRMSEDGWQAIDDTLRELRASFKQETGLDYLATFSADPTIVLEWLKRKAEAA